MTHKLHSLVLASLIALSFFINPSSAAEHRLRIVSLAPSLTEMVFAIGSGDLLVGVTDHCRYPPEAAAIAKVGGYQTSNLEAILSLRPDLVLVLDEHSPIYPALDALGLRYEVMDHRTLPGVLESFTRLGDLCDQKYQAGKMRDELQAALTIPAGYDEKTAPSLLFLIGRDYGKGSISNAIAVGKDGLYDQIILSIGCRNAYQGDLAYPNLSGEGVALLNPDIIIEGVYEEMGTGLPDAQLLADWRALPHLRAALGRRILYVRADYIFVPGFRMLLLKRDLEAIVGGAGILPVETR